MSSTIRLTMSWMRMNLPMKFPCGVELDRKSLILFHHEMFYCNGEVLEIEPADVAVWQQFANQRHLSAADIRPSLLDVLYEGYLAGYWHFRSL
jgi:50S ribosomal protein L16 3-hydroxylase